jgi:acyl carrier protein
MTRDDLIDRIFQTLSDELLDVGEDFTRESNLIAFGLDSLALTQLLLSVEEATGVWVDESSITEDSLASTVAFAELVYDQLEKS